MKIIVPMMIAGALTLSVGACGSFSNEVGSGKVLSLGKKKLILENKSELLFVDVTPGDIKRLHDLKKGEHVVLLGTKDVKESGEGAISESADVDVLVRDNGEHIRLGSSR